MGKTNIEEDYDRTISTFDDYIEDIKMFEFVNMLVKYFGSQLSNEELQSEIEYYLFYRILFRDFNEIESTNKDYNFWKEYECKFDDISKVYKVNIPKQNNIRYRSIRELDYNHLSNNRIVLELIVRDNEFKNLLQQIHNNNLSLGEYKSKCKVLKEKYGFNILDYNRLIVKLPYYNEVYETKEQEQDYSINNAPFIKDIPNGVLRVIEFYHKAKKLYIVSSKLNYCEFNDEKFYNFNKLVKVIKKDNYHDCIENNTECRYIKEESFNKYNKIYKRLDNKYYQIELKEELVNCELSDTYINENINDFVIEVEIFGRKMKQLIINDNFSLELLDPKFIETLTDDEKIDIEIISQEGDSFVEYNIPILSFPGSKLINFQINLDYDDKIIMNSIQQLRKISDQIKTSDQILYSKERDNEILKLSKKDISKGKNKLSNFADALYVYDLYKIFVKEFNKIKFELILSNKLFNKPTKTNLDKVLKELDKKAIQNIIMEELCIEKSSYYSKLKLISDFLKNKNYKSILLGNFEIN